MRLLLLIAIIGRFCFVNVTPDDPPPGEMGPAMIMMKPQGSETDSAVSQSLNLHEGWNLVSWNIVPMTQPIFMSDILPTNSWFDSTGVNKLYLYDDADEQHFYPLYGPSNSWVWDLNFAYYLKLDEPPADNWGFVNRPLIDCDSFSIVPSAAWDDSCDKLRPNSYTNGWFFMGYSAPGYCKLGTIFDDPNLPSGDPDDCQYLGPFHWLMWKDSSANYAHYGTNEQYLIIVKDDQGRFYIPRDPNSQVEREEIDQIGTLEPGRGYFLGFRQTSTSMQFKGWGAYPGWPLQSIQPDPKFEQAQTASGSHFQFTPYTHWSYPVLIDTVDLEQTPLATGDEIAVLDGSLCVGAAVYAGEFPLKITSWKDDIATPDTVDGYRAGDEMTFIWYDVSTNSEITFELPPTTQASDDDPIAPQHSGFGAGFYALRSMVYGVQSSIQLPLAFRQGQNYPNPFNSSTVIPLELPQRSKVKLEVFNLKGQRVGNLYESVENAGYPKVYYDASRLASGVYFCRVTAEGLERAGKFSGVSKLVLLK